MTTDAATAQVEDYIVSLPWSESTPAETITMVAGNIRGFAAWLRDHPLGAQSDRTVERVEAILRDMKWRERVHWTDRELAYNLVHALQDERESSLGRDAEGHLVLTLGPGAESPSRKEGWAQYDGMSPLEQREADGDR